MLNNNLVKYHLFFIYIKICEFYNKSIPNDTGDHGQKVSVN